MAKVMIDSDLIDDRLAEAMALRKERAALVKRIEKMDETYKAKRKPHDERIAEIDKATAELVVTQPVATAPESTADGDPETGGVA